MAKKKAKKRRTARRPGFDANERRRERLEARRRARAEAIARERRARLRLTIVRAVALAALVATGLWYFVVRGDHRPTAIDGHALVRASTAGVGVHRDHPTYSSRPPVSGPHASRPASCGTHSTTIPDPEMVAMLERGAVGILFKPTLDARTNNILQAIVGDFPDHTFSEPYRDMGSAITIVSWGIRMPLAKIDARAIHDFVTRFRARGPEPGPCDDSARARFVPPAPSPSPTT
jgi:uncharacterized protein DUF3105